MKRFLCIILCLLLLLSMTACGHKKEEFTDPVHYYYLRVQSQDNIHHGSDDSVMLPEVREGHGLLEDTGRLLENYLAGPVSETCRSPFPAGTVLVGWEMDGTTLCVTLSDQAAELTGIDLTLACACLARTFMELTGAGAVRIRAESLELDGKVSITMNQSILVLLDEPIAAEPDAS